MPMEGGRIQHLVQLGHTMAMRRPASPLLLLVFLLGACTATPLATPSSAPTEAVTPQPTAIVADLDGGAVGYAGLPIDTSLTPISKSSPTKEARDALDQCWGFDDDHIAAAALISSATDAYKYAPFMGVEPELQTKDPVWVVQYRGEWDFRGRVAPDPTCVVVDGIGTVFLTHGQVGQEEPVLTPPIPPSLALPPLGP